MGKINVETLIVGAGMSGLLLGLKLKREGRGEFIILEKENGVGGTWFVNSYPGCCCDIKSYYYLPLQYSNGFIPTRIFSTHAEIQQFLHGLADFHKLWSNIRLKTTVTSATYDESTNKWDVRTLDGSHYSTKYIVFANGPLSKPKKASIPGIESFSGAHWHTAEWNHSYDCKDKVVGIIGTGASAIQIVPELAKIVKKLVVFQRTPAYCFPKGDGPIKSAPHVYEGLKAKGKEFVYDLRAECNMDQDRRIYEIFTKPELNKKGQEWHQELLLRTVKDPEVANKMLPDYPQGCKRALLTDDYLQAFNRKNVTLVPCGVERVAGNLVITDSKDTFSDLDALVIATGFQTGPISDIVIKGKDGISLTDTYHDGIRSMFGMMTSGFPNMFMILGPQSWSPHGNTSEALDVQTNWVEFVISRLESAGIDRIEPLRAAETYWTTLCAAKGKNSLWTKCTSWYVDDKGQPFMWVGRWWDYVDELLRMTDCSFVLYRNGQTVDSKQVLRGFEASIAELPLDERTPTQVPTKPMELAHL